MNYVHYCHHIKELDLYSMACKNHAPCHGHSAMSMLFNSGFLRAFFDDLYTIFTLWDHMRHAILVGMRSNELQAAIGAGAAALVNRYERLEII